MTVQHQIHMYGRRMQIDKLIMFVGKRSVTLPARSHYTECCLFMVALCNRADHYIFALWFFLLLLSFLALSQPSQIGCLPYFYTWCGLNANFRCRSETCCTRLAENTGSKSPKIAICALCTTLLGCIFATKARIDNRKNALSSNIFSTCPHNMANFGRLAAEIDWRVWGTPANFNGFRVLASLLQRHRSTEANQTVHDVWPSPGVVDYLCIFGGCCPVTEFYQVQNSLCVVENLHSAILAALLYGTRAVGASQTSRR